MGGILLSGEYSIFNDYTGTSPWGQLYSRAGSGSAEIYSSLTNLGVFASAIAVVAVGISLIVYSGNPKAVPEKKEKVVRVCIVTMIIFAIPGLLSLVVKAAL